MDYYFKINSLFSLYLLYIIESVVKTSDFFLWDRLDKAKTLEKWWKKVEYNRKSPHYLIFSFWIFQIERKFSTLATTTNQTVDKSPHKRLLINYQW